MNRGTPWGIIALCVALLAAGIIYGFTWWFFLA